MSNLHGKAIARINIVGTSGSGKSTFARELSGLTGFPYIEMDKLFWKPHWQESSDEEFFAKLKQSLACESWILDGNYTRTIPIKWENIDLVVWLDYSFSRTLCQALCRAVKRSVTQKELWEGTGNKESFRKSFLSKSSIIWWTITSYAKVRERYESMLANEKYAHIKFVRIRSPKEAEKYLKQFE